MKINSTEKWLNRNKKRYHLIRLFTLVTKRPLCLPSLKVMLKNKNITIEKVKTPVSLPSFYIYYQVINWRHSIASHTSVKLQLYSPVLQASPSHTLLHLIIRCLYCIRVRSKSSSEYFLKPEYEFLQRRPRLMWSNLSLLVCVSWLTLSLKFGSLLDRTDSKTSLTM